MANIGLLYKNRLSADAESLFLGTAGGTRTPDLLVRSQSLYPAELQAHLIYNLNLSTDIIIAQFGIFVKCFFHFFQKNFKKPVWDKKQAFLKIIL